jgi:hypothetical protein
MKLRSLAEITEQRLTRMPGSLTKSVGEALLLAHDRVFGRGKSRSPDPNLRPEIVRPVPMPVVIEEQRQMPILRISALQEPAIILLQPDSSHSQHVSTPSSSLSQPDPTPRVPLPESPLLLPTPNPSSPPQLQQPSPPSEPEADPPSPDVISDEHTYLPSRNSLSIGSRNSQRTTDITTDIISFEDALSNRKQPPKRIKKKKQASDADLELVKKMNEEWERKQQLLAVKLRDSQEKELAERLLLEQAEAENKAKLLEERRRKLAAQREAAQAEKERREALLRQSSRSPEPLHRRMESDFKAISELEELEYHRKLQAIKDFMQPIQLSSLLQHRNWYETQKAALIAKKKEERAQRIGAILRENMSNSYYKAKALEVMAEEERMQRFEMEERRKYPSSVREKQQEYAKLTKELYKPVVLPESQRKLSAQNRRKRAISAFFRPAEVTNRRTVSTNRHIPSIFPEYKAKSPSPPKQAFRKRPKPSHKSESLLVAKPPPRYHNYLAEPQSLSAVQRRSLLNYQPRLRGKSTSVEELRDQAEKLGKKAQVREGQLRRLGRDLEAQIQACDSVSSMYIDSIKAKLQVLEAVSTSF